MNELYVYQAQLLHFIRMKWKGFREILPGGRRGIERTMMYIVHFLIRVKKINFK
jgi:hypothetical protein